MKHWPELRAGLILLAICFGLIDGCPLPPRDDTPAWERGFVEPIRDVQQVALKPVAWMHSTFRIAQRWALYQGPTSDALGLVVDGRDGHGRWQLLFRAGDDDHDAYADLIDISRTRGAWNATDVPPYQYAAFARWMTQRVLDDHPDFIAARVRFEKVRLSPDGVERTGQFAFPHIRQRGGP